MNHLTTSITVSETDCIKSRKSLPLSLMLAAARPSNVHANINPERKYIHKYKTMFTMANSSCNKCMLSSQAILKVLASCYFFFSFAYTTSLVLQNQPRVTKLFRIRIKISLTLNNLLLWTFIETYYTYLTIDCWYLVQYVFKQDFSECLAFLWKKR